MWTVSRNWNPWRELEHLRDEVNRAFRNYGPPARRQSPFPAVNIAASDSGLVLAAELPGVDPEQIDLTVTADTITIRGERPSEPIGENESWTRRERPAGRFSRTISLPFPVDPQSSEAACERGVMTLKLHRPEQQKPRKVEVKSG